MRVTETVHVPRPADEVYAALAAPERRGAGAGWSAVTRSDGAYTGTLQAAMGPIRIEFDCRFELAEEAPGESLRLRGTGTSPRMGFAFDARLAVRGGSNGGSAVDVDADVSVSGPLAGMGQRRLGEQARRLLAAYVAGQP